MTNDMTKGAITPLLIRFTIPLVLGNLFQLTYNAADSIIVGKFVGEEALAAVGTSNPLMTLAILFINGMCLGAGILVSTAFGAGDTQLMERQVSTTALSGCNPNRPAVNHAQRGQNALFLQHTEHLIQFPFGFRVHGQNILAA